MNRPLQEPPPGERLLRHRGDRLTITLALVERREGQAWLRTNIGYADAHRRELVRRVEFGEPLLERDWHDLPMRPCGAGRFQITIPLLEVGRFQAKAYFLPSGDDDSSRSWPEGDDLTVKVEPAEYVCASSIYSAFVRQFGENRFSGAEEAAQAPAVQQLEAQGYEVIPRSGKFRDLVAELDHVIGDLGFRIIQLLPIFPTPTTHARMGRFGSPFAALDLMDVDPALAEFDRKSTPLEQFGELLDETHRRGAKLFLDIPINHTGWASTLQNHHPEWFKRGDGTEFESPGAWGVTWEDLSELDYQHRDLWRYMAEVFLFWCRRGVDGFRCDAGYMIPLPVWEYITAKVRLQFPDTIFFLEGLGGDKAVVFDLLDRANLNWAYSELFQNEDRLSVESILGEAIAVSSAQGLQVHFSETHDNNRLASRSESYARMRTALAALAAQNGGFGITCGVEWFAATKIEVHRAHSLNWGHSPNLIAWVKRLNAVLEEHPAFWVGAELATLPGSDGPALVLLRSAEQDRETEREKETVLVLVNLDEHRAVPVSWQSELFTGGPQREVCDLLTGDAVSLGEVPGSRLEVILAAGEVRCLCVDREWARRIDRRVARAELKEPMRSAEQRMRAKVYDLAQAFGGDRTCFDEATIAKSEQQLAADPWAFCDELGARASGTARSRLTRWRWPRDTRRVVMWPEGRVLALEAAERFEAELVADSELVLREVSLEATDGKQFAVLVLPNAIASRAGVNETLTLRVAVFGEESTTRYEGELLVVREALPRVSMMAEASRISQDGLYGLATNGRGAMAHTRGFWSAIRSQYDALLAANPHSEYPVDRRVLLTRVRAWVVVRDFSRELSEECQCAFSQSANDVITWRFDVPVGMGRHCRLEARLQLVAGHNAVRLTFHRETDGGEPGALGDQESLRLILRPDLEDRGFHEKTKAFQGAEEAWPRAIRAIGQGFEFRPEGGCGLDMASPDGVGNFVQEPEWTYMVGHPIDAARGLDGASDLFSPGYFEFELKGNASIAVEARLPGDSAPRLSERETEIGGFDVSPRTLLQAAQHAMKAFIVKRDDTKTVIAGYPWFLDWGRDTLICLRGVIAAGLLDEARDVLRQFARLEKQGTLPNMIRGGDDSNRDTSDAPLWFFVACDDLARADGDGSFLHSDCGDGRTIMDVLQSIARGYLEGTPNGISVDPESGLVFSPSHFTWMDTNHPAGTPRVGYPIEIQALWYAALTLLARLDSEGEWEKHRGAVADAIERLFWDPSRGFLSDCLHTRVVNGQPCKAAEATADDHLRCNQLFAVTLGAVTNPEIGRAVVASSEALLVPGGIRSLADRQVAFSLPVRRDGQLLNDPSNPYWGRYEGDEDTRRKPAYHNGTVWTWPFPSYAEALVAIHGEGAASEARAILGSSASRFNQGCLGHLPEILDGDAPHAERGCGAQAWSVTELYRVLKMVLQVDERPD